MTKRSSLSTRWLDYRFSKTAYFWSCVACVIGTMVIGFAWGGWMTAGAAKRFADNTTRTALAQLAASYCVARFEHGADAAAELAALKKAEPWDQDGFIRKGGWVTPPGWKAPVAAAADICAQQLLTAKLPLAKPAALEGKSGKAG